MNGYLLDTNAASVLWDRRHREHKKIRAFLHGKAESPAWVSIFVLGEIEYGLKIAPQMDEARQNEVRRQMVAFPLILDVDKHTVGPYSDLRAALFKKFSPKDRRGRLEAKRPEDLWERTTAKELGVQENDIWIVAQAIQYNLVLITGDHMRRLEEVSRTLPYPLQLAPWK
jgi:tRNA(fMet)-specific endonuclease VapC